MSTFSTVLANLLAVLQASSPSMLVRGLLSALALAQAILPTGWPAEYTSKDGEHFHFIVVGTGSAGGVLCARLTEVYSWRVLCVEYGGIPPPQSRTPGTFAALRGTEIDYKYQAYFDNGLAYGRKNASFLYTRGKVLGGSSAVNYLVYSRGVPKDYDDWNLIAPGWSWNDVLPYFKKLENNTDSTVFSTPENAALHSTEGPVGVSRPVDNPVYAKVNKILLDSYAEMGIPKVLENNGPEILGVAQPQYTFANGIRSSTGECYVRPNKDRPNLFVAMHSKAIKLLIDDTTLRATGVRILNKDGNIVNVYADLEVILAGGTVDSPKLLMLSGIGPKEQLEKHGIKVIKDLPVGQNLQDHMYAPMWFAGKSGLKSSLVNALVPSELDSFPLPFQCGFFKLDIPSSIDFTDKPMFQFSNTFIGASAPLSIDLCSNGFTDELCSSVAQNNIYREMDKTTLILLHALSRGSVTLRSCNPLDDPIIDLGFLREQEDLVALREALKFMRTLENTTYFRNANGYLARVKLPECDNFKYGSNDYWDCFIKGTIGSMLHGASTCSMGPECDGVVDHRLRVHGIQGVRVIDASIMPKIPSGNTNTPAMMIGEKGADMIKEDYGVPIEVLS